MQAYCVKCRAKKEIKDPKAMFFSIFISFVLQKAKSYFFNISKPIGVDQIKQNRVTF